MLPLSSSPEGYTLRREISHGFIFASRFFLTFRVDLNSRIDYRWIFREDLFSRILVLSMLCIFLALFGYKKLNSPLNAWDEIRRSRYDRKIYIFRSMFSLSTIYYIIIYVIIYILLFTYMFS